MLDSCPTCLEKFYNAEVLKASLTYRYSIVVYWLHQLRVGQEEDDAWPLTLLTSFNFIQRPATNVVFAFPMVTLGHKSGQVWGVQAVPVVRLKATGTACTPLQAVPVPSICRGLSNCLLYL